MKALLFAAVLVFASAFPAQAQLKLEMAHGRVTLDAVNVPARQILAEWARIGGTKIVGGEKVAGAPLTLKLVDMPERQALDIILRNVAGFMAAPRAVASAAGASAYDRILIMATSSVAPAPANAGRATSTVNTTAAATNGAQRRVPSRPPNLPPSSGDEVVDDQQPDDPADTGVQQQQPPVFTFPGPQAAPGANVNAPTFVPMPNNTFGNVAPNGTAPVITLQPGTNGPAIYNFVPQEGQAAPVPPNTGFTVIGSPTPGMIQVPPPAPAPGQPTPVTRPPRQ